MLDIFILSGGEIFYQVMNAISALFGSSSWAMVMRWSLNVAVLGGMIRFIGTRDLVKLLRWVFIFIFIFSVLIVPKKSVQIIDLSDRTAVYKVDNIPLGAAILFSFTTRIGFGIAELYDDFFAVPDAVSFSRTGFLFGANLVRDSLNANIDTELKENFNSYVYSCVVGDIMLNNKYTLTDLAKSNDTLELITRNPSEVRRMIYASNGNKQNISCKEAANNIKTATTGLFLGTGSISKFFSRIRLSNSAAREMAIRSLLEDSYYFFYNSSKSATNILKQNIANNAIRHGISTYAGKQGDVGSLITVATESSQLKSRLNWAVSSQIATTYLPLLHTVMLIMLFSLFPIVIILTMSDVMGVKPLQWYALSLVYFMSWLPLYSILNYIMVYYTKSSLNGVQLTLENVDKIKLIHSDIGMVAGYLSLSIPFLALGIVKGFASVATNASNFLNASITGTASQVSSSAADGNWSLGNVSTQNVQGFKWDTNYLRSTGMMSQQLSTGAMSNMSSDGTYGINTSAIMSHLPTTGSLSRNVTQQFAQAMRYAETMTASAQEGLNSSSRNLLSNLSQLQNNLNKGGSFSSGYSNDNVSNIRKSVSDAMNAVRQYSQRHGVSEEEAVTYLNYKQSDGHAGADASIGLLASKGIDKGGKAGAKVEASLQATGKIGASFSTGSQDNIGHNSRESFDSVRNKSEDLVQQWSYAIDNLKSYKFSYNGNEIDNHNRTLLNNISGSYERAISSSNLYNEGKTVMYNLTQESNKLTSGSSTITSNLNNEFVKWVRDNHAMRANDILSNTADSNIAAERETLWQEFTNNYANNRINTIMNNTSPTFKERYIQESGVLRKNSGLDDSYNQIDKNVSNHSFDINKEISEGRTNIDNNINKIKIEQQDNKNVNETVIENLHEDRKQGYADQKVDHKYQTQTQRNIHNQADKDQMFKDRNPVQNVVDDMKNKNKYKDKD